MKIYTLPVGLIQTNCYLVQNGQNEAVLIDPGAQPDKILRYLEAQGLTLKMILLTHGHFDHMGGVDGILKKWDVPVWRAGNHLLHQPHLRGRGRSAFR